MAPALLPRYCVAALAVGLGLVAANYHFLGDVIAGAFLGLSIGWISTVIWPALIVAGRRGAK
jgi:membrane-associated phospholipid phosphatase